MRSLSVTSVLRLICAVLFTLVILYIPWQELKGGAFTDVQNYYSHAESGESSVDTQNVDGIVAAVSGEVLWRLMTESWIQRFGIDPQIAFGAISALAIFVFAITIVRNVGVLPMFLMLNPLVIDFAFSQLRLAFAISLLYLAFGSRSRNLRLTLVGISLFIHTAVILFVGMYGMARLISTLSARGVISSKRAIVCLTAAGIFLAVFIGPLKSLILSYFHDRRAEISDPTSSPLFLSFWIILLVLFTLQGRRFFSVVSNCYVYLILSLIAGNLIFGGYSTRFLAASFPLIVISTVSVKVPPVGFVVMGLIAFTVVQWVYWV